MKKRIGNDISFVWHIYRKSGETQTPESFTGKEVEVRLISPLQRTVTIEDVSIATGVVTFTFRGKHQVTLGNYVAVLLENRGEDGMVTLDVVNAVTLVPHSYMEEDGDEGDVIEAEAVELESSISAGSGGGFVQQQADWAQTDDTAVDYIKNKPNLDVFARLDSNNVHTAGYDRYRHEYERIDAETTIQGDGISSYNYNKDGSLREMTNFIPGSITLIKDGVTLNLSYRYFANLIASIQVKADVADLASLVNTGTYNSTSKKIELKHDNNVLAEIDATAFIKDGMVDSVVVSNGYIVITFNTDAGKETIRIPVTDIFDPSNYYDKDDVDGLLADKVDKETGKGLSTNDYTDSDKEKVSSITLPGATYAIYRNQWILDGNIATNSEGVLKIEATAFLTPTIVDGRLVLTRNQAGETPYFKIWSPFEGSMLLSTYNWDDDYESGWELEVGYASEYGFREHWLEPYNPNSVLIYVKAGWNKIKNVSYQRPLTISGISLQRGVLALHYPVTAKNMGLMSPGYLTQLLNKVDKVTGKGLSTNDYTTAEKTKLGALPTNEELTQALGGKANTSDLARVATSGSYNDLNDKPTLDDLNKVEDLYALDATNSDWKTKVAKMFDDGTFPTMSKSFDYCNLRIYKKYASGVEADTTAINSLETTEEGLTFADGTHFSSYKIGAKYYVGYLTSFSVNNESTVLGNIEITSTKKGTIKLYLYKCAITEDAYFQINGQPTAVKMPTTDAATILSFDVNEGDVISVSPTKQMSAFHYYDFGLVGMSFYSKYPVSRFVNDAGYLTPQGIAGKADKSEMSVVPGTGIDADKTTITLKQGTSATVLTTHQDITGKEDVTNIVTPVNATDATLPITTLTCEVGKYYRIDVAVDTLGVTLPAMTDLTTVRTVVICLTADTNPAVTISTADSKDVYYQDGFEIQAGETYEINALFNGAAWVVAAVKINVE